MRRRPNKGPRFPAKGQGGTTRAPGLPKLEAEVRSALNRGINEARDG